MKNILQVDNLSVDYRTSEGLIHALKNVSLSIGEGEVLGVVGESGSGKSTLALAISRLLNPRAAVYRSGEIRLLGTEMITADSATVHNLRGTGVFMVFQDPFMSLNPLMKIGDQLTESVSVRWKRSSRRFKRSDTREIVIDSLKAVRIGDAEDIMRRYPHQLSGGQNQRVMLAMAVAESPRLLIADEPTTALDVTTQAQVLSLLREIVDKTELSVLYITHDLGVAGWICDRIAVMYGGMIQETGPKEKILMHPDHPYTIGLIRSIPSSSKREGDLTAIQGSFSWKDVENKCSFAPRCNLVHESCLRGIPALVKRDNSYVRCVNYGEEYE